MSEITKKFEYEFAKYVGVKYALMVNSGSSANLLATFAAGNPLRKKRFKSGDEVLISALCWSTSLWPLIQFGLKPVFVDVDVKNNKIHYSIVYGASKNKRSWWNNSHAYKLGYKPKDNAEKYKNTKLSKNEYSDKLALKFQGGIFASKDFIGNINDVYNK